MFGLKPVVWIVINSVVSFVYLFIISKLLGKKQIAQLEFVDYAIGISLGSIAGEFAVDSETPFYYYIISMGIYFVFALLIAIIGRKSAFFKRLIKGRPVTLIRDGKIDYRQLCRTKIDVNDLLSMLRDKNYFDINDVAYAVFEPSGKLSVLPKGESAPVTVSDIKPTAPPAELTDILIVDGSISHSALDKCGKNEEWLRAALGCPPDAVILATYDSKNDTVNVHRKN